MVERNTKQLLLDKLKETGEDPEKVECEYIRRPPYTPGAQIPMTQECSASDLPDGELLMLVCNSKKHCYVKTDKRIETSPNIDPS